MMSTQEDTSSRDDLRAIDRVRDAHVAALNRGDVDAWIGVFSADAVQMPPNFPANAGREGIRQWCQGFLGAFGVEFALEVEEVRVAGDWAFERGAYRILLTPRAGGASFPDTGKYITIYERQPDGAWLMARDIWNSNQPMPEAP
jgi:uncharacterized protein (TIGR02246 family)